MFDKFECRTEGRRSPAVAPEVVDARPDRRRSIYRPLRRNVFARTDKSPILVVVRRKPERVQAGTLQPVKCEPTCDDRTQCREYALTGRIMDEKRFIKLFWGIKAFLVVVLLYVGFEAVSRRVHVDGILEPHTVKGRHHAPETPAAEGEDEPPVDYSAIIHRNLFADGPVADRGRSAAVETMPSAEELGLKLIGAIAGGPVASRAIIENTKDKTTNPYRIGDVVASATIESIQADVVILRYRDEQFALRLQAPGAGAPGTAVTNRQDTPPETTAPSSRSTPLSSRAGQIQQIFRKVQIEPQVANRQTQGLRITGLDKVPLAGMLGLRDGDVIQTINGQHLTSKQKAFQVMMKAKTQSRVNMKLLRDGKSKDLSFNL